METVSGYDGKCSMTSDGVSDGESYKLRETKDRTRPQK